jgi:hypothetical protein
MTEIVDLWPDTIKVEKVITPVTILRQQASLLGKKTKNIVQGEVREEKENFGALNTYDFNYVFYLVAPALNNYRYRLLDISYNVSLYPVIVTIEESIFSEIASNFKTAQSISKLIQAKSQDEFLDILKEIFNSTKVLRVISVLLSQSDPSYDQSLKEEETQQ